MNAKRVDRLITRYLLDELDGKTRAEFDALVQRHPALRERLDDRRIAMNLVREGVEATEPARLGASRLATLSRLADPAQSRRARRAASEGGASRWVLPIFTTAGVTVAAAAALLLIAIVMPAFRSAGTGSHIASTPAGEEQFEGPPSHGAITPEERARLRSLGYWSGPDVTRQPSAEPREVGTGGGGTDSPPSGTDDRTTEGGSWETYSQRNLSYSTPLTNLNGTFINVGAGNITVGEFESSSPMSQSDLDRRVIAGSTTFVVEGREPQPPAPPTSALSLGAQFDTADGPQFVPPADVLGTTSSEFAGGRNSKDVPRELRAGTDFAGGISLPYQTGEAGMTSGGGSADRSGIASSNGNVRMSRPRSVLVVKGTSGEDTGYDGAAIGPAPPSSESAAPTPTKPQSRAPVEPAQMGDYFFDFIDGVETRDTKRESRRDNRHVTSGSPNDNIGVQQRFARGITNSGAISLNGANGTSDQVVASAGIPLYAMTEQRPIVTGTEQQPIVNSPARPADRPVDLRGDLEELSARFGASDEAGAAAEGKDYLHRVSGQIGRTRNLYANGTRREVDGDQDEPQVVPDDVAARGEGVEIRQAKLHLGDLIPPPNGPARQADENSDSQPSPDGYMVGFAQSRLTAPQPEAMPMPTEGTIERLYSLGYVGDGDVADKLDAAAGDYGFETAEAAAEAIRLNEGLGKPVRGRVPLLAEDERAAESSDTRLKHANEVPEHVQQESGPEYSVGLAFKAPQAHRETAKKAFMRKGRTVEPVLQRDDDSALPSAASFIAGPVNPWELTKHDRLSTFAMDVDTASYALGRSFIRRGYLPPPASVRMEEYINAFDYNYSDRAAGTFNIHAESAPSPFRPALTLMKIGVKGKVIGRDDRRPAHLVLVVDASGSMDLPDRMPLVQHALKQLVTQLDPRDRISLIAYGADARLMLETTPASDAPRIIEAIDAIQCGGSTNMLEGLRLGYQIAGRAYQPGITNQVILLSDGVANVGEVDAEALVRQVATFRHQGITFTAAGFGMGRYNDALLETLANRGDGQYVFIDSAAEARRVFGEELSARINIIARDAKIQVEFDPRLVRRYRLIGYENRAVADRDFRNDTIDAGEVGSGQSVTALYELELFDAALARSERPRIATVFVRYRDVATDQIQEIARSIEPPHAGTPSPRFMLAACAAQFAELMRGSEHATDGTFEQVQRKLDPVTYALPLDSQIKELLDLTRQANSLAPAP